MYLEELINGVNLEDYQNEFKGVLKEGRGSEKEERAEIGWLKEIVAFANTLGGTLYVGVDNKTHEVLALTHEEVDRISLMVQRFVLAHIEPPIRYRFEKIPVPSTLPTRYVLAIHVEKSKCPPISLRFHSTGVIYVRHFGKTSVASGEEIRNLVMNSEAVSFDTLETNVPFKMDDFTRLFQFYREQNDGKELTEKDLLNVGFMTTNGFLKKGALLFKDDCQDSRTLIECSKFKGVSKGDDIFLASETFKGNLIDEYLKARDFVLLHSVNGFKKTANGREKFFSYPPISLGEGIANAIGHRNYFIQGGQIEINLFLDRLEIVSPGSLVSSKWLREEKELSKIPPLRRNELICAVFTLCRLMDHKGSGFDKIEQEYESYGKLYAPFVNSDDVSFSLTLPDLTHQGGLVLENDEPSVYVVGEALSEKELRVLSFCYAKERTAIQIASALGIKPSSYLRKTLLGELVKKGYLSPIESGRMTLYLSNKEKVYPL